jgi:hypothetical protein
VTFITFGTWLPGDTFMDGLDVQEFVTCLLAGGDYTCAILNAANGLDSTDIALFITDLVNATTCPR